MHPRQSLRQTACILIVSPNQDDLNTLRRIFEAESEWEFHWAATCAEGLTMLRSRNVAVVICRKELTDGNWKIFLEEVQRSIVRPVIVVCSHFADEFLWAEVLNLGAYDLVLTPFEQKELNHVLRSALLAWNHGLSIPPHGGTLPNPPAFDRMARPGVEDQQNVASASNRSGGEKENKWKLDQTGLTKMPPGNAINLSRATRKSRGSHIPIGRPEVVRTGLRKKIG